MDKRGYSSEGIVIARRNIGEADRIVTVFTKYDGKRSFVARGVRKITSRKKGALELFTHIKFFATSTKNLAVLSEVEVVERYNFGRNLAKIASAYQICEITNRLTAEEQENRSVFDVVQKHLKSLVNASSWQLHEILQSFKVRVLQELGFLERDKSPTKNLDQYIENLINGQLRTKKFLSRIQ